MSTTVFRGRRRLREPAVHRLLALVFLATLPPVVADDASLAKLERSYWVHASLASLPQRGYWGADFPAVPQPREMDIRNAARLLAGDYAANRLYLLYHNELPVAGAEEVFAAWRRHCPAEVEVVPTLVLRAYDKQQRAVFSRDELGRLAAFFKRAVHPSRIAVYDVHAGRDPGRGLAALSREFPAGIIRVGAQPEEAIAPPFVAAVPIVAWARVRLRRHTVAQTVAGVAVGGIGLALALAVASW